MKPEELASRLTAQAFATEREKAMQKAVLVALRESQKRTPVRTGHLRRSETTRVENGGMRGLVGTNVVYAPFVHARIPFFEEGIAAARTEILRIFTAAGEQFFSEAANG